MYCSNCGYNNAAGAVLCAQCGVSLAAPPGGGDVPPAPSEPGPTAYPPPGGEPGTPPPATPGGGYPPPQPPPGGYPPPGAPGPYGSGEYPAPGPVPQPGYPAPPGFPPGPGYGPPGGPPGPGKKRSKGLLFGLLAVLVVAAVVAGAVLVLGGDDDSTEVVLEPISSMQEDDFAGNLDVEAASLGEAVNIAIGEETPDPRTAEVTDAGLAGQVVEGASPAVYGGSRNTQVCDVAQLLAFFQDEANVDKAEAWAGVQGIGVDEIPGYIEGLTAVRLRFDTRVTNHGFRDGEATPFQSVLQAGTAVLVDNTGVPRVKCACGNPLAEPESIGVSGDDALDVESVAQNPDAAWEGFDPEQVIKVEPSPDPVEELTLVDFESGGLIERPVGSDGASEADTGTGDVQVTLEWGTEADLDLHVFEPDGTEIYYGNRGPTGTGGQLDVDGNAGCTTSVSVENIFWPAGDAPTGNYRVEVNGFSMCDTTGEYTLTISVSGQEDQVYTESVGEDETDTYEFTV